LSPIRRGSVEFKVFLLILILLGKRRFRRVGFAGFGPDVVSADGALWSKNIVSFCF
jgi:hypothetical protein